MGSCQLPLQVHGAVVAGDEVGFGPLRTMSNTSRLAASAATTIMKAVNFRGLGLSPT